MLRGRSRAHHAGAHLVRRRGQSLDVRDLQAYAPGDDIRHVDWRASQRYGGPQDHLIRTFELEAQTRVVISIDARASMQLPLAAPKVILACWLAEAIAYVAARSGDLVALHALFGAGEPSVVDVGRTVNRSRIRRAVRRLTAARPEAPLSFDGLQRVLPPASIWILLTDLYFDRDEHAAQLVRRLRTAQRGARWVILVELDSWPHEQLLLGHERWRIEGPGLKQTAPRVDVTPDLIGRIAGRIADRRSAIDLARAGGYTRVRWEWTADTAPAMASLFRRWFFTDRTIQRLLMKDAST